MKNLNRAICSFWESKQKWDGKRGRLDENVETVDVETVEIETVDSNSLKIT